MSHYLSFTAGKIEVKDDCFDILDGSQITLN